MAESGLVHQLSTALDAEDDATIRALFEPSGLRAPKARWSPSEGEIPEGMLRSLLDHWRRLQAGRQLPHQSEIDAVELRSYLGLISILEPTGDGDFRCRLFGSMLAQWTGFDLTGALLSEMKTDPIWRAFVVAGHRLTLRRREPLLTVSVPPATSNAINWTRLVLPFAGDDGSVSRLLIGNTPGGQRMVNAESLPPYYSNLVPGLPPSFEK